MDYKFFNVNESQYTNANFKSAPPAQKWTNITVVTKETSGGTKTTTSAVKTPNPNRPQYIIVSPSPIFQNTFTTFQGEPGYWIKLGDGVPGKRYDVHMMPNKLVVENPTPNTEQKDWIFLHKNQLVTSPVYWSKGMERQLFEKTDELTEWHWLTIKNAAQLPESVRIEKLENLRGKLWDMMEYFQRAKLLDPNDETYIYLRRKLWAIVAAHSKGFTIERFKAEQHPKVIEFGNQVAQLAKPGEELLYKVPSAFLERYLGYNGESYYMVEDEEDPKWNNFSIGAALQPQKNT